MLFSDQLAAFRARTTDPGFEGLILLGTEQHNITAGLLLGTLSTRRVAFLTTPETHNFPRFIAGLLGMSADDWEQPLEDHSNTLQVYRSIKALCKSWVDITDPAKIAVDVTGGRKPMSVGLEKAAHILGLTTIYVESDYWPADSGKRGPQPGTQRLVIPPNPYIVFGDLEAAEARRLYAAHDYAGAGRIFHALAQRVTETPGVVYGTSATLAKAYAAWDVLDFKTACAEMEHVIKDPALTAHFSTSNVARVHAQMQHLKLLTQSGTDTRTGTYNTLRENLPAVLALLGSLYTNALRREDQERYDFASLLLYRSLELMSRRRLAHYGIDTESSPRPGLYQHYQILDGKEAKRLRIRARDAMLNRQEINRSIQSLKKSLMERQEQDDELDGDILQLISQRSDARNQSILAHGFQLIAHNEYRKFRNLVEIMLEQFLRVESQQSRAEWHAQFTFVSLE